MNFIQFFASYFLRICVFFVLSLMIQWAFESMAWSRALTDSPELMLIAGNGFALACMLRLGLFTLEESLYFLFGTLVTAFVIIPLF